MKYKSLIDIERLAHEISNSIIERVDFDEPHIFQIYHCLDRFSNRQKYVDWKKMNAEQKTKAIEYKDEVAYSADDCVLSPGQEIWVNNSVLGYPPKRRIVGKIVNRAIINFDQPDQEGYIGCKSDSCWISLNKAYYHALQQLDQD